MKKVIPTFLLFLTLLIIYQLRLKEFSQTRILMDTICEIKVYSRINPQKKLEKIFKEIARIDTLMSFEKNGDIKKLNQKGRIKAHPYTLFVVKKALKIAKETHGKFDITIRPIMEIWKDFEKPVLPNPEEIKKFLNFVDYEKIMIKGDSIILPRGFELDLSGIAKGFAVDLAVELLKKEGFKKGLVNFGGDIKVFGNKNFIIGVKHPRKEGIICKVKLKEKAIATSGDYEKYFEINGKRYHHILNPETGYPAEGIISVTVIADNAIDADAFATALFLMKPEKALKFAKEKNLEILIITKDLKMYMTEGFKNLLL